MQRCNTTALKIEKLNVHGEENSFISQKFKAFLMTKSSRESDVLVTERL